MNVYRLSLLKYAQAVDGAGARIAGGRWNQKNIAIVYTAENRSLAVLELLVHISFAQLNVQHGFVTLQIPKDAKIDELNMNDLPSNWRDAASIPALSAIGSRWAEGGKSVALRVPSVIVPEESNVLLNPTHSSFSSVIVSKPEVFKFDRRLLRLKQ